MGLVLPFFLFLFFLPFHLFGHSVSPLMVVRDGCPCFRGSLQI